MDGALRQLDRQDSDPEDASLLRQRMRSGALSEGRLRLAAGCGVALAQALCDELALAPREEACSLREAPLLEVLWEFKPFGEGAWIAAGSAIALHDHGADSAAPTFLKRSQRLESAMPAAFSSLLWAARRVLARGGVNEELLRRAVLERVGAWALQGE